MNEKNDTLFGSTFGARIACGNLCEAKAPTEPAGESWREATEGVCHGVTNEVVQFDSLRQSCGLPPPSEREAKKLP